ncbi:MULTISPECIES: J domain-containing protein [Nostocales]|uniref:J domain-containing protein n=1 Tax=Nostocales TaxID=1161 RepID=UPI00029B750C|nr:MULTISPECIES: J domain-containing protein [Nostocales]AFW95823.1 heat shock protein DnaJ domain-containing protein [Anabaena sp. 90]MTJ15630.1 J domain-containing protein [Dolichospermum sp. UHCC 0299]MTJ22682.1 J domain-containing protein [Dolichospermum sp. UHCC 0352]MTJ41559.1 J domain-containing protein [Dolichospermum sp. UHCC 0406]
MVRKTKTVSSTTVIPLALSDLHLQLAGLEKEHQSLLKQIKKKRTELNNFVEKMRSLATEVFHRVSPNMKTMAELDAEIHALFAEILTTKKMGKQTQKNIQSLYRSLQMGGIISYKPIEEEDDDDEELDELFEDNDSQENHQRRRQFWEAEQDSESPTVARTDESRKIRQTFLRLAEIFHPDKVKDNETQMTHTEIMKEINKAYQDGDLARLLEIERKYEVGETIDNNSEDDLSRRCRNIEQHNQILKNQYEKLKQELRLAKNTPEGSMVADYKKAAKQGVDCIELMLETMQAQTKIVVEIRDFVQDFKDKKITIKEFLAGPESLRSMKEDMMEELLERMMEEFGGMMDFN